MSSALIAVTIALVKLSIALKDYMIKKIFDWYSSLTKNDPVKHCDLYKNEGCSHVDGLLCDFPECSMLKDFKLKSTVIE